MRKILTGLYIVLEKREKKPLGDIYTYRKMNPYPLTWFFIFFAIPVLIFQVGYTEMGETLKGVFQWK